MTQFVKLPPTEDNGMTIWINPACIQCARLFGDRTLLVRLTDGDVLNLDLVYSRPLIDALDSGSAPDADARKAVETLALRGLNSFVTDAMNNETEQDDDLWNP